jgi:hypothetical protein
MRTVSMSRRAFLGGLSAAALALAARPALAAASRVRTVASDENGTTLALDLDHAPFPAGGAPYQDRTVFAFVPKHHRTSRDGRVSVVVHFHGHNTTAERAMAAHELREQLADSKQNAILLVPQGPVMAADSSCGKLEAPGGLARMLDEALAVLASADAARALGPARISAGTTRIRTGTVCLSAHSGGYHAAAACAKDGGVDVNEIYLFDALYANEDVFRDWVVAGKGRGMRHRHKLVSYYGAGASTETESQRLLADLEKAGVRCAYEKVEGTLSREELTESEAVFVRTALAHNGVTHELNALRDCLYASGLTRHLRTAWFDNKRGARPLERRRP